MNNSDLTNKFVSKYVNSKNISWKKRSFKKLGQAGLDLFSAALAIRCASAEVAASPSMWVACGILIAKTLG